MKIMGIDYGKRRIGLSICDEMEVLATPIGAINEGNFKVQLVKVAEKVSEYTAKKIVLGLPKNMDGSLGFSAELVNEFGEKLQNITGIPVIYLDERLTTVTAATYLNEMNVRGSKRKNAIDTLSAVIILQDYLDAK